YCAESSFFLQAEDGIRDRNVTGVQTCALPILRKPAEVLAVAVPHTEYAEGASPETMAPAHPVVTEQAQETQHVQEPEHAQDAGRSEERRVGKEGRPRGGTAQ